MELKDPAPTCQCVDYRIRKRICKHQKLVLLQLGIPDAPQDWYKVFMPPINLVSVQESSVEYCHYTGTVQQSVVCIVLHHLATHMAQ